MRKRLVFLLTMTLGLLTLLEACLHPVPAPRQDPRQPGLAADDVERRLVAAKPKLMSADYRADLDELARLRDEVVPLTDDPALGYLAHYWAGFASWRIAINGASRGMSTEDLKAHLKKAGTDFDAAVRLKEDFADAHAAAAGVYGWLGTFYMRDDPAAAKERFDRFFRMIARAKELEPDNPRVLWISAVPSLVLPPEKGGNLDRAIEIYRRMDEVSPAASDAGSPLPDWGKPEALMSLANAHLQRSPANLTAAGEAARAALRLQPEWFYVRDVLMPQIEAAQAKR
jgi:tetratricopeptide (TPR) repeat protein